MGLAWIRSVVTGTGTGTAVLGMYCVPVGMRYVLRYQVRHGYVKLSLPLRGQPKARGFIPRSACFAVRETSVACPRRHIPIAPFAPNPVSVNMAEPEKWWPKHMADTNSRQMNTMNANTFKQASATMSSALSKSTPRTPSRRHTKPHPEYRPPTFSTDPPSATKAL